MGKSGVSLRARLALSGAGGALVGPGVAHGQQAEVEASGDTIIIVTAQKREQNLQDVPASISVVGGETLIESGAAQISDLTGYVPGLHINNLGTPGQSRIALRGISPLGASASVGVYIDEAPVGSSTAYTEKIGSAHV